MPNWISPLSNHFFSPLKTKLYLFDICIIKYCYFCKVFKQNHSFVMKKLVAQFVYFSCNFASKYK